VRREDENIGVYVMRKYKIYSSINGK
jgi:hypothetical protein